MKICVAQTKSVSGNIAANINQHLRLIEDAVAGGADMIFFPELSLTGYEPLLAAELATYPLDGRFAPFQQCSDQHRLIIGVGLPVKTAAKPAIALLIFKPGAERTTYAKQYLHADEMPYFSPGSGFPVLVAGDQRIALAICYELTVEAHTASAFAAGATLYLASVAKTASGAEKAIARLSATAAAYSVPVLLSNCIGPCEGEEGGGRSSVWNADGAWLGGLSATDEGFVLYDTTTKEVLVQQLNPSAVK